MPKKAMKVKRMGMARGASTGSDVGAKVGQRAEDELVKLYNSLGLARGGMARGGYPRAGVGSDVGSKIGQAVEDWATNLWHSLGFARGGMAGMPPGLMAKTKMYLKRMQGAGTGADVGAKLGQRAEDELVNFWHSLGFARGGGVSHSVF